jgi:hypothetical protein
MAFASTVTHISAATASLVWVAIEWAKFRKPSLVGWSPAPLRGWQPSRQLRASSALVIAALFHDLGHLLIAGRPHGRRADGERSRQSA